MNCANLLAPIKGDCNQKLQNKQYQAIVENSHDAIGIFSDNKISYANNNLCNLLKCTLSDIMASNILDYIHFEDRVIVSRYIEQMPNNNEKYLACELRIIDMKGQTKHIELNLTKSFCDGLDIFIVVMRDITARKQAEEHLQYFSFRDSLSGLYNRRYFEEEMWRMDQRRHGSVGVIVVDVDGLKLVNDMFGHDSGDKLLANVSTLLAGCFREQDIVARIGGDEYAILFNDADYNIVAGACARLEKRILTENLDISNPPLSLSIGFAVSDDITISMGELLKKADSNMYLEKLAHGQKAQNIIVQRIMKLWEQCDFIAEGHGDRIQEMVLKLGRDCGLEAYELSELCLLAQFHDVGKIGVAHSILLKTSLLTADERIKMQEHAEIGYRIARSSPDIVHIAELILKHHEWWNGAGYPLGLTAFNIPLECRILAIADAYDAMTNYRPYREQISHVAALKELKRYAGIQFDPELVMKFIKQF